MSELAIPPLQATGILPPGEHHATLRDIIITFPPTVERQHLHQVLQDVLPALQTLQT